jgi:protein-L-isoaspartate(D-aspartate) O-methyltransferase
MAGGVGIGEGDSYGGYRSRLVEALREKGIRDLAVLRAVGLVPRHLFVPPSLRHRAYDDAALPIGGGQTISQPWVQARYLELLGLTGRERVLEVGTGSGYQTALLALLCDAVFSVERIPPLARSAREAVEAAGIRNVTVLVGDGTLGWRPFAPYDAIWWPRPNPALWRVLAPGGAWCCWATGRPSSSTVRRQSAPPRRCVRAAVGPIRLSLGSRRLHGLLRRDRRLPPPDST